MSHRMEYPRPQLVRDAWLNLNGAWQFEFDDRNVGAAQRWYDQVKNSVRPFKFPLLFKPLQVEYTTPLFMTMSGISVISHLIQVGIRSVLSYILER